MHRNLLILSLPEGISIVYVDVNLIFLHLRNANVPSRIKCDTSKCLSGGVVKGATEAIDHHTTHHPIAFGTIREKSVNPCRTLEQQGKCDKIHTQNIIIMQLRYGN